MCSLVSSKHMRGRRFAGVTQPEHHASPAVLPSRAGATYDGRHTPLQARRQDGDTGTGALLRLSTEKYTKRSHRYLAALNTREDFAVTLPYPCPSPGSPYRRGGQPRSRSPEAQAQAKSRPLKPGGGPGYSNRAPTQGRSPLGTGFGGLQPPAPSQGTGRGGSALTLPPVPESPTTRPGPRRPPRPGRLPVPLRRYPGPTGAAAPSRLRGARSPAGCPWFAACSCPPWRWRRRRRWAPAGRAGEEEEGGREEARGRGGGSAALPEGGARRAAPTSRHVTSRGRAQRSGR